jgi:hypothetical protein
MSLFSRGLGLFNNAWVNDLSQVSCLMLTSQPSHLFRRYAPERGGISKRESRKSSLAISCPFLSLP